MHLGHDRTSKRRSRLALCALGLATVAMLTLHIVQRGLNPLQQPVSFYVHGEHGWLFTLGMGCFAAAAIVLSFAENDTQFGRSTSPSLIIFGAAMLLAAVVLSDRWFPWEAAPTTSGVVHAVAAVLGPPVLLIPMLRYTCRANSQRRRFNLFLITVYTFGLIGSALSLVIGFIHDGPPPFIGLTERVLAIGGLSWLSAIALGRR